MKLQTNESLAFYLSRLKARSGLSLDKIAKAMGLAGRSSVQRYFEDDSIVELKPVIARKFAHAFYNKGEPPIRKKELWRLASFGSASLGEFTVAIDQILDLPPDEDSNFGPVEVARPGYIAVVGTAYASNWRDKTPAIDTPEAWLSMPSDEDEPLHVYAVRIIGPSINKTAPDGFYAICRKFGEGGQPPPDGKFLHVERVKDGFTEWSVKRARWSKKGMLLYPDSDHPEHQDPLPMAGKEGTVTILGVVIAWHKPA